AAGRAGRAVGDGVVGRRAPCAGGRAGGGTGAAQEPGRMTAIMCARTFRRAAALASAVVVTTLAAALHADAEPRRLRVASAAVQPAEQTPEPTPGRPANENVDPAELGRLFDAYTVM